MKKFFILAMAAALAIQANALVVEVNGEEIPAEGKEITVTESEIDIFTEMPQMSVEGMLSTSATNVNVTIQRSETGLEDQFCCGGQCTNGNGETTEERSFAIGSITDWYVHYFPAKAGETTTTYIFSDGTESRRLIVHFNYTTEGTEDVQSVKNGAIYNISGARMNNAAPGSIYIQNGQKRITTY